MTFKEQISQIYNDNKFYQNPSQATNLANTLNTLSTDLYTDSKRFIYELLQNADDSQNNDSNTKVWIKIIRDTLVVAHSGKNFSNRDLIGICNVDHGTKKNDITKTGYKGIGFKSVFGQSEQVTIFTNNEFFRFDSSYDFGWSWKDNIETWEKENDRKFKYPWQIIPIYTTKDFVQNEINKYINDTKANVATIINLNNKEETKKAIINLTENLNMFLFLKNINEITFDIDCKQVITINRETTGITLLKRDQTIKSSWITKTLQIDLPKEIKETLIDERNIPKKLLEAQSIEISFAAKIKNDKIEKLSNCEKLIYSYLPTDEIKYSFPILVNTSFLTTANRESLHVDSKWNQWIFKNIAVEIFKWIAELCKTEYGCQAYNLIPKKTSTDELGTNFNAGIDEAINTIPFILSQDNTLVFIKNTIIDYTLLSFTDFIGKKIIKEYIKSRDNINPDCCLNFSNCSHFNNLFKELGAKIFEWAEMKNFLYSESFLYNYTIENNIKLIKHFKSLANNEKVNYVTNEMLRTLPFILDHKNHLNYPPSVCFPTVSDKNWNNPESELNFIDIRLHEWLRTDIITRKWLENLGIKEKTDVTYINQNIIPNIDNYINKTNAISAIRDLFTLYGNDRLNRVLMSKLKRIKLLTNNDSLLPAEKCFLSNFYNPRVQLEGCLELDIYVNQSYCEKIEDKNKWKQFLMELGVKEGINIINFQERTDKDTLENYGIEKSYLENDDKKFTPYITEFTAASYTNLITINHITQTIENYHFTKKYWEDLISNYSPENISKPTTAFWGRPNLKGMVQGDTVENYVPWFIKNYDCLPTMLKNCLNSKKIFINDKDIIKIASHYLPIFDGPILSSDWKSFFNFKTNLNLSDYLEILNKISLDSNEKGKIKKENKARIQEIYSRLLETCANWSTDENNIVENWAKNNSLLNTNNEFTKTSDLFFYCDDNENIFQDKFIFININSINKKNRNIKTLMNCLNITIINQDQFSLEETQKQICQELTLKMNKILPFFKLWLQNIITDESLNPQIINIDEKFSNIKFYEADELIIKNDEINFTKKVNVHSFEQTIIVTKPWDSNSVLIQLPEVICNLLDLKGYDNELNFLLRAEKDEIIEFFENENIPIPATLNTKKEYESIQKPNTFDEIIKSIEKKSIPQEFFHISDKDFYKLKHIQDLLPKAKSKIIDYLKKLPNYDCSKSFDMTESIIGGILKDGSEILIVTRPSDDNKVILYYTSEFDVLEYVDSELWCTDGESIPRQITLGNLLKQTEINRIPIITQVFSQTETNEFLTQNKSEIFEINAIPYIPEKLAINIAAFANYKGGTIIFGIKERIGALNEIIGLNHDFNIKNITNQAISKLNPTPKLTLNWQILDKKEIYVIKIEKSINDIRFEDEKYIRKERENINLTKSSSQSMIYKSNKIDRTLAIIISLENYAPRDINPISPVKYATEDALAFKRMLIEKMNVLETNITFLSDTQAYKSMLEYDLKGLFYELTENDRLIFYFVGHGFHDGITNYLSTYDMNPNYIINTSISLREILLDPLKKSKCENALIFIDSCAQSLTDENSRNHLSNINFEEFEILQNKFPYYGLFYSCHEGQSSYSCNTLEHGIWTYFLLKALSGKAPVCINNNYITDKTLSSYLEKMVSTYAKKTYNFEQNPKSILDTSCENIIMKIE